MRQQESAFDIDEARRVLADVFAPWVNDLGLSDRKSTRLNSSHRP